MNHRTPAEERLAAASPPPDTRAALRAEIDALYDLIAAVAEALTSGVDMLWLIAYVQGIKDDAGVTALRNYAADIRAKAQRTQAEAEQRHVAISDGPDCGCGLGAARCRELEDGGAS